MSETARNPYARILADFDHHAEEAASPGADAAENETLPILSAAIARYSDEHVDEARIDREGLIPPEVIRGARELGLFGMTVDPKYGGAGLSMKACCYLADHLGRIDRSLGTTVMVHAGLGLAGLNRLGSALQKAEYLPDLAAGRKLACFAVTESEAGSDLSSIKTTAVRERDELVVHGSKVWVTNGGLASVATIVARTPGVDGAPGGYALLLVPLDRPGVTREPEANKLGLKGSSTCGLRFDGVRIPRENILGVPGRGLDEAAHPLSWGRTLMAAGCVGIARTGLRRTVTHVTNRRQFGRPIAEFGMVREKLATMRSTIYTMESMLRMISALESEQPSSIAWESLVAKVFCSEAVWCVVDNALQLHGGSGFIEDTGIARLLRDCRISRIFEGANELLRFRQAATSYTWDPDLASPGALSARAGDVMAEDAAAFDELLQRFGELLRSERKTYGSAVFKRQMSQRRVSSIATDLYAWLALAVRAKGESRRSAGTSLMWSRHAVYILRRRIEHNLAEHDDPQDDLSSAIASIECEAIGSPLLDPVA